MKGRASLLSAVLFSCAFLGGCQEQLPPNGPSPARVPSSSVSSRPFAKPGSIDEVFANEIDGYGGAFRQDGALYIYLLETADPGVARSIVARELQRHGRPDRIVFIRGDYTFAQLSAFTPKVVPSLRGSVLFGVDSKRNRYWVQFQTEAEIARFKAAVHRLHLPIDAFIVELGKPARVLGTKNI